MISQFSESGDKPTLKDLGAFPRDVYPVGRLDTDSEGLLLLTNDKSLNNKLLNPTQQHRRTYLVQVDGAVSQAAITQLETGVKIRVKKHEITTRPAGAEILHTPPDLPPRNPPVRYRKNIPTSWIRLTLHEGKNRQVRRMTAAVGFPTLRLVRWSIEDLSLQNMKPGEVKRLSKDEVETGLRLSPG